MARIRRGVAEQRARAETVRLRLRDAYPEARCSLDFTTPLDLLVATILSAQCTDERVNIVTKDLFRKYRSCEDYLRAPAQALETDIHSCGFFRQKARSIREACQAILDEHGGRVPGRMEALTRLQGVGRKTANVILATCFGQQTVIVDTHCRRVNQRLGFTKNDDPDKIEQDLMKVWPPEHWTELSHLCVFHGRNICVARGPRCSECPLADLCPFPDTPEGKRAAK